jgi:hypothetical protein
MERVRSRAKFDWLVELAGAVVLAISAGFAGLKLAPSLSYAAATAMAASAVAGLALGLVAMRLVKPAPRQLALAPFEIGPVEAREGVLLLDNFYEEPLLLEDRYEEPLLLDDPLVTTEGSRVVQLFAAQPTPTAGELKDRIDRHLAGALPDEAPTARHVPDASDALHAALDDLRRSLR